MDLHNYIRTVPDFPKPGISFKDISPLLADPDARRHALDALAQPYSPDDIDVVVGIESRGFLFGMLLADRLDARFVMARKPGKLPGTIDTVSYALEYGQASLELQKDAIPEGSRVLLHDDVLATGGTAAAATKLIEQASAQVVGTNFLIELEFLEGRQKLSSHRVHSILRY